MQIRSFLFFLKFSFKLTQIRINWHKTCSNIEFIFKATRDAIMEMSPAVPTVSAATARTLILHTPTSRRQTWTHSSEKPTLILLLGALLTYIRELVLEFVDHQTHDMFDIVHDITMDYQRFGYKTFHPILLVLLFWSIFLFPSVVLSLMKMDPS